VPHSDEPPLTQPRQRRKRAYHHGDLRAAVIDAGFALLAEKGLDAFSVAEIARRVGVSTAAPYRHFADRDEIVAAMATQAARELATEMRDAVDAAGDEPVERFAVTAGVYVRYVAQRGAGFNVIFATRLQKLRDESLAAAGRELIDLLLGLAVATGRTPADALVLMERHIALAHGYVGLFRDGFFPQRNALGEVADHAIQGSRDLAGNATAH
jgi:AcrR family transcriptional regulator